MPATAADFARIGNYARMYNPDRKLPRDPDDPSHPSRSVPMRVLALGYSRTGTLSMHNALTALGIPTYHFSSMYDNVRDCDVWARLLETKFEGKQSIEVSKRTFDALLGDVQAVVDMPCHLFAAELMSFYPDAHIVLVERPIEKWYVSWSAFLENAMSPAFPVLSFLDPSYVGRIARVGTMGVRQQTGGAYTLAAAKARSRETYAKHYAFVRALAREQGREVLEFRLEEGWEPLCKLLGVEAPADGRSFPHVNEKEANEQGFKELALIALKNGLWNVLMVGNVVGAPAVAAIWWWRKGGW